MIMCVVTYGSDAKIKTTIHLKTVKELPWPSGYELRLSLEVAGSNPGKKSLVDDMKGIRSKNAHCSSKVQQQPFILTRLFFPVYWG